MTVDPDSMAEREQRLHLVLASYFDAADRGAPPDRQALLQEHPELADELIEFFAAQHQFHELTAPFRSSSFEPDELAAAISTASQIIPFPYRAHVFEKRSIGDYDLLEEIALGGMGVVYRARQRSLNRLVAIKLIRGGAAASKSDAQRFQNEALAVANLDHPNIVPIHEVGEEDGCSFFSMKLIEKGNLSQRLEDYQDDPRGAARLTATIARAVHHAHERGILHRDLKPSNILIDDHGHPLVADFGLARQVGGDSELTQTGAILGTPAYMAPEQAAGGREQVTIAADVHGLGAILYAVLAGRSPFRGVTPLETLRQVQELIPELPSTIRQSIDRDLETICQKCLEKEPGRRYASALAVAEDLERWLTGRSILARPTSRAERLWRICRRDPRKSALTAAVIVLLATSAAGLIMGARTSRTVARLDDEVRTKARALHHQRFVRDVKQASQLWADNRPGETQKLLDQYLPTAAPDDGRNFTWHYFHRLSQVGRPALAGHQGEVYSSTFSPDGTKLATAGQDRKIHIWDARTGEPYFASAGHTDDINWVSWAPDGGLVASASDDQTVRLWDAASGQLRSTLVGHRDKVVAAEFTPDGKHLVSCAREGGLFFWDLAQLPQYESYRVQNGNIQSLSIAPGGAVVAIGGHSTVVWSMADRRDLARPPGHLGQVNGVAFSHDGKHLAGAGEEGLVRVWDTRNWQLEATLVGHRGPAFSVAFSPDDRTLASVDIHGIVHIWDVRSGARDTIASGQGRIWCVSFSPDGRTLATVSRDSTVKLWDLARDRACVKIAISAASMPSLAFSRDSNNLTVVNEKGQLWKFEGTSGRLIESRRYDRAGPVQRVALSKEASLLVTVAEVGPSTLWDLENDRRASGLPVTEPSSMGIAIAPEGRSIALQLGYLEKALVWHSSRAAQTTIDGINGSYDFSPSGEFLTTFGRAIHEPQLWEVATGRVHRTSAVGHRSSIDAEAFSPDGKSLATGSGDGTIIVWAVPELERRHQLPNVNAAVGSLGFSPDGRTLVAGYQDHLVRLWDYESGTELATLEGHSGGVVRATFSPDGLMLATCAEVHGGGFEVFLWRATAPR